MNRWREYEFFAQVVETGSISKAGEALNLSSPTASRRLAALEKRLGARLVERTTRRLFITDVGQNFYTRCKTALEDMSEAEEEAALTSSSPSGTLRVTASLSLMVQHVATMLPRFAQQYPDIKVQLIAANQYHDITDNDIDVAIRTREYEPDSSLVIRRLARTRRILAASPSYIEQYGAPSTPADLENYNFLAYSHHNPYELTFTRRGKKITATTSPLLEANDGQIARVAAVAGLGILAQPIYVIYDELLEGRLIPVMLDWKLPEMLISLVYRRRKLIPGKTRAFLDFMLDDFHENDYEKRWEEALTNCHRKTRAQPPRKLSTAWARTSGLSK